MIVVALRTDKPQAEIGLYDQNSCVEYDTWQAHRELSETIHHKLEQLLSRHSLAWPDIEALVVYEGPGSFTGLRIGMSVANALAYGLNVPIVTAGGDDWIQKGIELLQAGDNQQIALPVYGSDANITLPRS